MVEKDGMRIAIPANSLKKSDGSNAMGTVEVHYTVADEPAKAGLAPGGMKGSDGGRALQLEPSGLIDVRFYQSSERLTFVGEAELTFPLGPSGYQHGDELDIWSFNEAAGRWQREGKGQVERLDPARPGRVQTRAKHFTWWAAATELAKPTCVSGTLRDADGLPVAHAQVEMRRANSMLFTQEFSDDAGGFCLPAPQDAVVDVWALGSAADELWTWSWRAPLASAEAVCGGACTQLPSALPMPLELAGEPPADSGVDAGSVASDGGVVLPADAGAQLDAAVVDAGSDAGGGSAVDAGTDPVRDGGVDPVRDGGVDPARDASVSTDAGLQMDSGTDVDPLFPEICTNGVDDDEDGLADCQDSDCPTTAVGCTGALVYGAEDYVDMGWVTQTEQPAGSVEFWFRTDKLDGMVLVDLARCAGGNAVELFPNGSLYSQIRDCTQTSAGSGIVTNVGLIRAGEWTHVAHAWTDTRIELYVNGVLAASTQRTRVDSEREGIFLQMARHRLEGRVAFSGRLDDVRVWGVARSAQEIAAQMSEPLPGSTPGLLGYWRFDEGTGVQSANAVGGPPAMLEGAGWFPEGG